MGTQDFFTCIVQLFLSAYLLLPQIFVSAMEGQTQTTKEVTSTLKRETLIDCVQKLDSYAGGWCELVLSGKKPAIFTVSTASSFEDNPSKAIGAISEGLASPGTWKGRVYGKWLYNKDLGLFVAIYTNENRVWVYKHPPEVSSAIFLGLPLSISVTRLAFFMMYSELMRCASSSELLRCFPESSMILM